MPAEIHYALDQISWFLDNHDLAEDNVGLLVDIHVNDRCTALIEEECPVDES